MKVVCIDKGDIEWYGLTVGKTYDAVIDNTIYRLVNDNGETWTYSFNYFKPLSEIRNERIDDILL